MNQMKSNYRIMALDEVGREQFTRVAVAFAGLADIMTMYHPARVAAAIQAIPQTRFNGQPPSGMNATGESDMKNYVMMMEAKRERMLKAPHCNAWTKASSAASWASGTIRRNTNGCRFWKCQTPRLRRRSRPRWKA